MALALAATGAGGVAATTSHDHRAPRGPGTFTGGSFYSKALRGADHYSIYLPPGYSSSKLRYPVIYFLHGLPQRPSGFKSIGAIATAVRQSGDQAIVVGPQGARSGEPDPEWLDHGPGRDWETATAVELVHTIDSRYRTIATRSGRVLIGISAGGYGATLIGSHHPATFSVIESWSGYFHPTTPAGTGPLSLGSEQANDWADFRKQVPSLRSRYGRWWASTWFGFYVGTDDSRFRSENESLYAQLRAANVPHVTFQLYNGGHDWSLWQGHAVDWVKRALDVAARPR